MKMLLKLLYPILAFIIGTIIGRILFRILKVKKTGYRVLFQKGENTHQNRYY